MAARGAWSVWWVSLLPPLHTRKYNINPHSFIPPPIARLLTPTRRSLGGPTYRGERTTLRRRENPHGREGTLRRGENTHGREGGSLRRVLLSSERRTLFAQSYLLKDTGRHIHRGTHPERYTHREAYTTLRYLPPHTGRHIPP